MCCKRDSLQKKQDTAAFTCGDADQHLLAAMLISI